MRFFVFILLFLFSNYAIAQIAFEKNLGQFNTQEALYKCRLNRGDIHFTKNKFVYRFYDLVDLEKIHEAKHHKQDLKDITIGTHVYSVEFIDAQFNSNISPSLKHRHYVNYFKGKDPAKWFTEVPLYQKITYQNIYNGIDVVAYEEGGQFKYDYVLSPHTDPSNIKVKFNDVNISLKDGALILETSVGEIKEEKPLAYQLIGDEKKWIPCNYILKNNIVQFEFPEGYNSNEPLIIDPTVTFVSYTGSSADNWGFTATPDNYGNMFTGGSVSTIYNGEYPTNGGSFQTNYGGGDSDIAISKFNASGTTLLFSTYLGGSSSDLPHSLIVDSQNNLIVMGSTGSSNFPVTSGTYDGSFNGGTSVSNNGFSYDSGSDIFLAKFNTSGTSLIGATYLGGSANDGVNFSNTFNFNLNYNYGDGSRGEVYVDENDNIYVASCTKSTNFPTTSGANFTSYGGGAMDGCVSKFNTTLTSLLWSTYVGGSGDDACYSLKVANNNIAYVAGGTSSSNLPTLNGALNGSYKGGILDGFVLGLNANNGSFFRATYLGTQGYDQAYFVEIDEESNVYVLGQSLGNYPVTNAGYSNNGSAQFIHKINSDLSATIFSTVIGDGSNWDVDFSPSAFMVDICGRIFISGWGGFGTATGNSSTYGLPVTSDAFKSSTDGEDFYFMVLEKEVQGLVFASFFGGDGPVGEHVDGGTSRFDRNGFVYQAVCAGCGGSDAFPTTSGVVSETNGSPNCNLGAIKIQFDLAPVFAAAAANPDTSSCLVPFEVEFGSESNNVVSHFWNFGVQGATSTQENPTYTYTEPGFYTVTYIASNPNSCNQLDTFKLNISIVLPPPPVFDFDFDINCETFGVTANANSPTLLYEWQTDEGDIYSNVTNINHNFQNPGDHTLTLIGTDPTCLVSDTIEKDFYITPFFNAFLNPSPAYGCAPLNVNFSGYMDGVNYQMTYGDGVIENATNMSFNHTYVDPGSYDAVLIVSDTGFCNSMDTTNVTILVGENGPIDANFDFELNCDNLSVDLTNTTNPMKPFAAYTWNFGNGVIQQNNDTNFTFFYSNYADYNIHLLASDSLCNEWDTISKLVQMHLVEAIMNPTPSYGCKPLPVLFENNSVYAESYLWNFGDGSAINQQESPLHTYVNGGTFDVTLSAIDSSSCNIIDMAHATILVGDAQPVEANFTAIQNTNCGLHLFDIDVESTGEVGYFQWNMGDGMTVINSEDFDYSYENPGNYVITLLAVDTLCNLNDTSSLPVLVRPEIPIELGATKFICSGEIVTLETGLSNHFYDFIWSTGDSSSFIEVTEPGIYSVSITDGYCLDGDIVEVKNPSSYDLGGSFEQCYIGELVTLDVGIEAQSYLWNTGKETRTIVTDQPGLYSFTVIDNFGCIHHDTIHFIKAKSSYDLWLPNTFTPNNDGLNDKFKPVGEGVTEYEFLIFDRWGNLLFESRDFSEAWEGRTSSGEIMPLGVYQYKLTYRNHCTRAEGHSKYGFIQILK